MADDKDQLPIPAPELKPLFYTRSEEVADMYPGIRLIPEETFNDAASTLETSVLAGQTLVLHHKVGGKEYEPVYRQYQFRGCNILVKEPVLWDFRDEYFLGIFPYKGCDINSVLIDLGLKKTPCKDSKKKKTPPKPSKKKK